MKLKLILNVFLLLTLAFSLQSCLDPEVEVTDLEDVKVDNIGGNIPNGHGGLEANFSFPASSATEGDEVTVRVSLNAPSSHEVSVDVLVTGANGALAGNDFEIVGSSTVFFPKGSTESEIKIKLIEDQVKDGGEQVLLVLQQSSQAKLGSSIVHRISIMDAAQVNAANAGFAINSASVAEDAGSISIDVGLDKINSVPVKVHFELLGSATSGADYAYSGPSYVVIDAGQTTKSFSISITNDTAEEDLEDIILNITNVEGANVMQSNAIQVINIIDDDKAMGSNLPLLAFALQSSSSAEDSGTVNIVAKLDKAAPAAVTFDVLKLGDAVSGQDYTLASTSYTIEEGGIQVSIPVNLVDDTAVEAAMEYLQLAFSNIKGAMPGQIASHSLAIVDNDGQGNGGPVEPDKPLIAFNTVVGSGTEGQTLTVNLSLNEAVSGAANFEIAFSGNATLGGDFNVSGLVNSVLPISIPEGQLNASFTIALVDDSDHEPVSENIFLVLTNPSSNIMIGQIAVHQIVIQDNDMASGNGISEQAGFEQTVWPIVKMNCTSCHVNNNTRPKFANGDISIAFAAMSSNSLYDLANPANSPIYTHPAGGHQSKQSVAPSILSAIEDWADLVAGTVTPPAEPPMLNFANANSLLTEGDITSGVQVTLDKAHATDVSFQVAVSGAAEYGQDYTLSSANLTIPAGQTSVNVVVNVMDDQDIEIDEDIVLVLTNASTGISLGSNIVHYKKIVDNDSDSSNLAPSVQAYNETLYPYLVNKCGNCHRSDAIGLGIFAEPDVTAAHDHLLASNKVNFADPISSRLVTKQLENHNCSGTECTNRANNIKDLIVQWKNKLDQLGIGTGSSNQTIFSASVAYASAAGNGSTSRVTDGLISLFEFKEGSGTTAADTSGVAPAMNLTLQNTTWVEGGGIEFKVENNMADKAYASVSNSVKLYNQIAGTNGSGVYTIEAWIAPANVTQEGPARIISYSNGTTSRNFTLGQVNYNYDFRNRSSTTGNNGTPSAQTPTAAEALQAQLQHVVAVFGPNGRKIYVDGQDANAVENQNAGNLNNWANNYQFLLGNETSNDRQFEGIIKLVAIYKKALTPSEIQQNFNAGFAQKVDLEFDISQYAGAGAKIAITVSEFDAHSYLIENPRYVGTPRSQGVDLKKMTIAINDKTPEAGQAYKRLDMTIDQPNQQISAIDTVIFKDLGPANDVFKLQFDKLGDGENVTTGLNVSTNSLYKKLENSPMTAGQNATRTFQEINETYAAITGVSPNDADVKSTYLEVKASLPMGGHIDAFTGAHQVNLLKLSLTYCNEMVNDTSLRAAFFPGFNFGTGAVQAFDTQAERDLIIDPIYAKMVGEGLSDQPTKAEITTEIETLMSDLVSGGASTSTIVKASCASVLGSAAVLIK